MYVLNKKGKVIRSATGDGKYFAPMALTGDLMIARTNYKSLAAFNKETGNAIASWTPPSDCEISGIALRGEQIFVSCWNSKQKTVIITALTLSINVDLILAITFGCLGFLILMTGNVRQFLFHCSKVFFQDVCGVTAGYVNEKLKPHNLRELPRATTVASH